MALSYLLRLNKMSEILLFTKPACQKCEYVKERMPEGLKVDVVDTTTAEGLAEAAYYELLNKPTPILVVDDEVFEGAIVIMNKLKSLSGQC
jgi:hypothetical protein